MSSAACAVRVTIFSTGNKLNFTELHALAQAARSHALMMQSSSIITVLFRNQASTLLCGQRPFTVAVIPLIFYSHHFCCLSYKIYVTRLYSIESTNIQVSQLLQHLMFTLLQSSYRKYQRQLTLIYYILCKQNSTYINYLFFYGICCLILT